MLMCVYMCAAMRADAIDIFLNSSYNWAIELFIEGREIGDHLDRFMADIHTRTLSKLQIIVL